MTVYKFHTYYESGEPSVEADEIPNEVSEVWEVKSGVRWSRHPKDPALWVPDGEADPVELEEWELYQGFGPVTDNKEEVAQ